MSTFTKTETAAMMETRLGVYQVLARLWIKEVDEDLLRGLESADFPELPEAPELNDAYRKLEAYLRSNEPEMLEDLAVDYAVLCRGVDPKKGAHPYESVHLNPMGLMMQDEWETVLRFYREVGLERSSEAIEPEDHLGIELECIARLCQRYLTASEQGNAQACADAIERQLHLLEAHLLVWVPIFAGEVIKIARTDFYRSAAIITAEYLSMDAQFLREI
ncbi:MAG: molecular chaperone TorD family protein [Coriobacteriales bacterium]|nr:molecular chaperone TorD family protein [Coriobacteriales bacterium]